jgi:hypothetical protein
MNEWQEYVRKVASLPPDQQEAEIAKLTPEQRRAFEEARRASAPLAPPPPLKRRRILPWALGCGCLALVGIATLFLLAAIGGGGIKKLEKEGRNYRLEQEQQESQQHAASATSIAAVSLVSQYDANEVAADQAFKGRILEIDGIIDKVGKDLTDTMYVSLKGPEDSFRSVQCYFTEKDADNLARLSPGQHVKVLGRNDGLMMNVQVKECRLVE